MAYNSIDRIPRDDVEYWLADHASKHRNLVDNPFFTINSRQVDGTTGVTAPGVNTFCVDRWKFNRGVVKTLPGGGINYTNADGARFKRLFQSIYVKPTASDELTITMHCTVNNNSGGWYLSTFGADASQSDQMSNIIAIPTTSGECWIEKTFSVPNSYTGLNPFGIGIFNAVAGATIDIDIYAIKLERGNYSTLKMDYPPNYYDEVIKCKTATVDANDTEANKTIFEELTVQKNAISAKAPVIIESTSGDIASFADGADGMPIRKIVGTIVPVQSGTGDPSPDNVRPISGWTGAIVKQTARNMMDGNAVADREEYRATTLPINWQTEAGTIYGGTVTLNADGSADVVADRVKITYSDIASGLTGFKVGTTCSRMYADIRSFGLAMKGRWDYNGAICNIAPEVMNTFAGQDDPTSNPNFTEPGFAYSQYVHIMMSPTISDANAFKATISDFEMVAPLATPQTYHFDNIGQLYTYLGTNNVWIDTGSITECDYPADIKLYIDGLTEPDEDMIANANIASGKYFVVNNQLYLSTAAIAAGASIVPGTNCTATNLAEALNALNT